MSDKGYYNTKYNFGSNFRKMMEERIGAPIDLTYVQIENILKELKGEYKKCNINFTEQDKNRIISSLKETNPNTNGFGPVIENLTKFLKDSFTFDEHKAYLEYCIKKFYKAADVYKGCDVYNGGMVKLLSISGVYQMRNGIIINKKYVNHIMNFFNEEENVLEYDKETLMMNVDTTEDCIKKFNEIKGYYNIQYFNGDDIFIIVANDEESTELLKETFKGVPMQKVLDFSYYSKQVETVEESDEMNLGNGMVMKGNFTNIGNVNGTQIIGVGASGTDADKADALDMITRIMNGDMSRCGGHEECECETKCDSCSCNQCDEDEDDDYKQPTDQTPLTLIDDKTFTVDVRCWNCGTADLRVYNNEIDSNEIHLDEVVDIDELRLKLKNGGEVIDCHGKCDDELNGCYYNNKRYVSFDVIQAIVDDFDALTNTVSSQEESSLEPPKNVETTEGNLGNIKPVTCSCCGGKNVKYHVAFCDSSNNTETGYNLEINNITHSDIVKLKNTGQDDPRLFTCEDCTDECIVNYGDLENDDAVIKQIIADYENVSTQEESSLETLKCMLGDIKTIEEPTQITEQPKIKITSADCVAYIVNHLKNDDNLDNRNPKNWKRISIKGSNLIRREFKNNKSGKVFKVFSTDTEIISIVDNLGGVDNNTTSDLEKMFPYKKVYEYATIWTKEKNDDVFDGVKFEKETKGNQKQNIEKGKRIGFGEDDCDGNFTIYGIIEYTKDGYFYNSNGSDDFTSDGIIVFEVENKKGFCPSSEPVDLLDNDYENGGGCGIENKADIKKLVELYNINVLLIGV